MSKTTNLNEYLNRKRKEEYSEHFEPRQRYSEFGRTVGMSPFLEQDDAMKTCRDWTNTKCQYAHEIIPMLEKYAQLRTMETTLGIEIPKEDKDGYDSLEIYRRKAIKYWGEALPKSYAFPSIGELTLFSTFHWSLYNMNQKITQKSEGVAPLLYNSALARIELKDGRDDIRDIEYIKQYRKVIEPEFERIKKEALEKTKSESDNWYHFW
jgi:hypothetical protein